jgi:hypothetical protein
MPIEAQIAQDNQYSSLYYFRAAELMEAEHFCAKRMENTARIGFTKIPSTVT